MKKKMPEDIRKLMKVLEDHTKKDVESRDEHREELRQMVIDTIKSTVNGKIDGLTYKVDSFVKRSEPVIKAFEDDETARRIINGKGQKLAKVAGGILAISASLFFLVPFIKFILS